LRAISADYERGLFRDEDADVAIRPEVFHIHRGDVTKMKELVKEGRKAVERKIREIKKLF